MTKDLLTLGEVEQLVPCLQEHFQELLYHKKEMGQRSNRLRHMGGIAQLLGRIPTQAASQVQQLQSEARRHYRQFRDHLSAIENLGGEIKDLELGRVDFACYHEGTERTLTWQLGVTEGVYLQPVEEPSAPGIFRTVSMQMPAVDFSF